MHIQSDSAKIIVAIDGHSSCGKSTMAKALARRAGYIYVDTGAMYRAVTLFALRHAFSKDGVLNPDLLLQQIDHIEISFRLDSDTGMPQTYLCGENVELLIRGLDVSQHVSEVAALPFVRAKLTKEQQRMGEAKGIVMDGRDIGTAVFPNAELKIFVTASAEVRAQRRYEELLHKGLPATYEEILKNVVERDYIDSHREVNPLRQAPDALLLDNSHLSIEEENEWLWKTFQNAVSIHSSDSALR
ncbi:MAG: (d)CMP kinase [Alloprevotella sp.]|nr:(d)CMP kinase [Alloprevotella sp.]